MFRQYIERNITSVSIVLFVVIFCIIQYVEPAFLYEKDGSLRQFGLGSKNKTVIPIWFSNFYYGCILLFICFVLFSHA